MRSKPAFNPDSSRRHSKENDSAGCLWGCLWTCIATVGGYHVFTAIDRVWSGHGSQLDHMICYGVLIGFVMLVILARIMEHRDKKKLRVAQQEWKRTGKSVEVAIVNRSHYPGGSWEDQYGIPHNSRPSYHLSLELTAEQRALYPNLQSVRVTVDASTYSKTEDRDVVRVYYQPDSPMTFMLEEELE
jgi:hypothetical protein